MKFLSSTFSTPEESPGFLLWQVCNAWQRKQREALSALKLTHVQFVLLASIVWLEQAHPHLSQAKLAAQTKTDPMMTSQVLRTLEKSGHIKRSAHPSDTRAFSLSLTLKGRKILAKALVVVEGVDKAFFSPLKNSTKQFCTALKKVRGKHD